MPLIHLGFVVSYKDKPTCTIAKPRKVVTSWTLMQKKLTFYNNLKIVFVSS